MKRILFVLVIVFLLCGGFSSPSYAVEGKDLKSTIELRIQILQQTIQQQSQQLNILIQQTEQLKQQIQQGVGAYNELQDILRSENEKLPKEPVE